MFKHQWVSLQFNGMNYPTKHRVIRFRICKCNGYNYMYVHINHQNYTQQLYSVGQFSFCCCFPCMNHCTKFNYIRVGSPHASYIYNKPSIIHYIHIIYIESSDHVGLYNGISHSVTLYCNMQDLKFHRLFQCSLAKLMHSYFSNLQHFDRISSISQQCIHLV